MADTEKKKEVDPEKRKKAILDIQIEKMNKLIEELNFELEYFKKLQKYAQLHDKYFLILRNTPNLISKSDLIEICDVSDELKRLNKYFKQLKNSEETEEESE